MRRRQLTLALGSLGVLGLPTLFECADVRANTSLRRQLFEKFAKSPGFSASFVEEKRIALLKRPIVNHGRLYFSAPAMFARHLDKPFRSAIFLKNRKLTLWDGSKTESISLDSNPALAALATSFLSLLQGDQRGLSENYTVAFHATTLEHWELRLLPKRAELKRLVRSLAFSGRQLTLTSMRLVEASHDSSSTTFSDVNANRTFSAGEKSRYFSVPKS